MNYDVAIIGGGVVGCAILNKLTRKGKKVVLIEKENDVATGTSKANSGIVHAGFDCKPNTLKAKFNVRGNELYFSLCKELDVPLNNCGALVVGNDKKVVNELLKRGKENGVGGLEVLNREQLLSKLPNLAENVTCGLYAKTSCVVSPYMFTIALAEEAVINGAAIMFNTDIKKCKKTADGYELSAGKFKVRANTIINATGANYNVVAKLLGTETYNLEYKRGEYYLLDSSVKVTDYTVFPLPSEHSKGILVSPTVDGNTIVGPTSYLSDSSVVTTAEGLLEVKTKSNEILTNVPLNKCIRNFSGTRTICGSDFIVEKSKVKQNIINIAGICSPGLTAAPAIAEYVCETLLNITNDDKKMIKRKAYTNLNKLTTAQKNKLIAKNPDYGKIICKCECVSLGEIKEALSSPLKPNSVDSIKRRVRAGMGRCQGGFCLTKVIETISSTLKVPENLVVKENKDSQFYVSEINPKK